MPVRKRKCKTGLTVQSIMFPQGYWSLKQARKWLRDRGHKAGKPDITDNFYRFRQYSSSKFKDFRTIEFGDSGIKAIIGCPK